MENHIDNWREQVMHRVLCGRAWMTESLVRELRRCSPDRELVVMSHGHGDLMRFLQQQNGLVALLEGSCNYADNPLQKQLPYLGWYGFDWQGSRLELVMVPTDKESVCMGDCAERVRAFCDAALGYTAPPEGRVLRYAEGWDEAPELEAQIKKVTWADLVLPDAMLQSVRQSAEGFFANRDTFAALGCAWRRGVLVVGPPGTGKTMLCKAIGSALPELPFLYVSDVRECDYEDALDSIFGRARELAPCVLVFEDVDGLLHSDDHTKFLNELDGFADNEGLLVVATSNHPERIDAALLKRPSRFDRVFHIDLPAAEQRKEYCRRMLRRIANQDEHIDIESLAASLAGQTEGFTPAYLKEAFSSTALQLTQANVIRLDQEFADVLMKQVSDLRAYLKLVRKPDELAQIRSHEDTIGLRRL